MKLRIDDLENRMRTHDATTRAILGRIMSRAFARLLLAALTVSSLALTSCGPSSITAPPLIDPTKPKDAFEGIQCSAIRPPTEPDLMGWDPGSRLNLSRLQHSGVVGVRYKAEGCNVELEVLN